MSASPSKSAGGVITASGTVANAAPAGTSIPLNLKWLPTVAATRNLIIPGSEVWQLTDLYIGAEAGAGGVAPQIGIYKDVDHVMDYSEVLTAVIVSNPGRPNGLHSDLAFQGATQMSMTALTTILAAAAGTITAYIPFEKHEG